MSAPAASQPAAAASQAVPTPTPEQDVLIVGAGPAGLALACALADIGLTVTVLEQQDEARIADPQPDGRDIALTHRARSVMQGLGLWQRLPEAEIAPIRAAHVSNANSPRYLRFDAEQANCEALGFLVPNHWLRKVAYDGAKARGAAVRLLCGASIRQARAGAEQAEVVVGLPSNGGGSSEATLRAPLLVAADSRFSTTRRRLGIGANSRDFGRTVIVARFSHEREHDGTAHECFRLGNTLAILPMNDRQASAVVTVRSSEADAWMALSPEDFAARVAEQFGHQLGAMQMVGERHAYPLVAVYAHRFATHRVALIGDAAVGMHPVTAHGYNFGLYGIEVLTQQLDRARRAGRDLGVTATLAPFELEHRRVTLPIYLGTNLVVGLFTDDRPPAKLMRQAVLAVSDHLPPVKDAITRQLTGQRPGWLPDMRKLLSALPPLPSLASLPAFPTRPTSPR